MTVIKIKKDSPTNTKANEVMVAVSFKDFERSRQKYFLDIGESTDKYLNKIKKMDDFIQNQYRESETVEEEPILSKLLARLNLSNIETSKIIRIWFDYKKIIVKPGKTHKSYNPKTKLKMILHILRIVLGLSFKTLYYEVYLPIEEQLINNVHHRILYSDLTDGAVANIETTNEFSNVYNNFSSDMKKTYKTFENQNILLAKPQYSVEKFINNIFGIPGVPESKKTQIMYRVCDFFGYVEVEVDGMIIDLKIGDYSFKRSNKPFDEGTSSDIKKALRKALLEFISLDTDFIHENLFVNE
jgi:hypothetical protein